MTSSPAHTLPPHHHHLRLHGRTGAGTLALETSLAAPWTVLFGPSGCGKTTVLRALAGLLPSLETTFTRYNGNTVENLSSLPPEKRRLGYAPQGGALFPHLTARENLAFPLGVRHSSGSPLVPELLHLLQLEPLQGRRPPALSGGEHQRVALARALAVPDARLVLLDEPFAGLDRTLRDRLLPALRAWLSARSLPVLSVTHDVDEALLLGAEVIRLHVGDGAVRGSEQGPAEEVLAPEVARLRSLLDSAQGP